MRTLILLTTGLVLLMLVLVWLRRLNCAPRDYRSTLAAFVAFWAVVCAAHTATGLRLGYSLAVETLVFALTFGLPAALAWSAGRCSGR